MRIKMAMKRVVIKRIHKDLINLTNLRDVYLIYKSVTMR